MLVLNTRYGTSTLRHNPDQAVTWHELDVGAPPIPEEEALARLEGLSVCVLGHGFNVDDAFGAYSEIERSLYGCYDAFVGLTWPGSTLNLGFWSARWRAEETGRRLAAALAPLRKNKKTRLTYQGHSMGCRVGCESLKAGLHLDDLILAAAAIGDDDLDVTRKKGYGQYLDRAERVFVAYSQNDAVLKRAYRLALWDGALGLRGPRNPRAVPQHVKLWDLSEHIQKHGDYKRSVRYKDLWREAVAA
jgi:esterase/lipase superfamily enzyme